MRQLVACARGQAGRLGLAALCMGISALATALYAYLLGPMLRCIFIGADTAGPDGSSLRGFAFLGRFVSLVEGAGPETIALIIVGVAAVKGLAFFGHSALTGAAGANLLHDLRTRIYRSLLAMNPLDERALSSGDLTARLTADAQQIEGAVTSGIVAYIRHGAEMLTLAALALALDPMLGAIGLIAFPPAALAIARLGRRLKREQSSLNALLSNLCEKIDETRTGLPVIRSFGAEREVEERFSRLSLEIRRISFKAALLRAISSPFNEVLGAIALGATLVYAVRRIDALELAPEAFISFFSALFLLYQPVKGLGVAHHAVQTGRAALSRLSAIGIRAESRVDEPAQSVPEVPVEVALRGVAVGYPGAGDVLTDLNLVFRPGEKVAVVGPSGAGKSTLLNLLEGLLPPRRGFIEVDGEPFDLSRGRGLFAPVRQEPFLFDDTIRMNVRIGKEDASDKDIAAACLAAGVTRFAEEMQDGLDTRVGPYGEALSVGQRQRVCLARAIVSRAPVLLLDEVTASLDGETEQSLVAGLDRYIGLRTVIVVTHRFSTAKWASRLVLIDGGTAVEDGESFELLRDSRRVAELFGQSHT